MAGVKPTSKSTDRSKPNNGRRSFIRKAGAALSAVIASAATGFSKPDVDRNGGLQGQIDRLSSQVGNMEDANAIRHLHRAYESRLDQGMYEEVVAMFAEDAEVVYNGGRFTGKDGIRRLYCDLFSSGLTGKKIQPAPIFEPAPDMQEDIVEVAIDRKSATGQFPFSLQVGIPMTGNSSLVQMARLQGEGFLKWWEGGICRVSYVKIGSDWKIKRLEYRATSKADYKPGRSYAKAIDVPAFSSVFPVDPTGPDHLV